VKGISKSKKWEFDDHGNVLCYSLANSLLPFQTTELQLDMTEKKNNISNRTTEEKKKDREEMNRKKKEEKRRNEEENRVEKSKKAEEKKLEIEKINRKKQEEKKKRQLCKKEKKRKAPQSDLESFDDEEMDLELSVATTKGRRVQKKFKPNDFLYY
jgi:hypothetical protein